MNTLFKKIVCLSFLALVSCSDKKNQNMSNNFEKFVLKDSITINQPNLIVQDVNSDNILLLNYRDGTIVSYNLKKKETIFFNKTGNGYDEYSSIFPGTISFLNDSIIGVGEISNIKKYSLKGEYLGGLRVKNEDTYASLQDFKILNNHLFAFKMFQGNPTQKSFYDQKIDLFLKKNIIDSTQINFIEFPFENSDFVNGEFYFPYPYEFFINYSDNIINISNSNDSNIYRFSNLDGSLVERIHLDLKEYNPLKIRFGQESNDPLQSVKNMYSSGTIRGYNKNGDYDILFYSKGLDRSYVNEFAKQNNDFPHFKTPKQEYWFHILKNNKPFKNDILFPENMGQPVYIISKDSILSIKENDKTLDREGKSIFYISEILN